MHICNEHQKLDYNCITYHSLLHFKSLPVVVIFMDVFRALSFLLVFFIFVKKKRENVCSYLDKLFKKRKNVNIGVWSQIIMDYLVFSIIFLKNLLNLCKLKMWISPSMHFLSCLSILQLQLIQVVISPCSHSHLQYFITFLSHH